MSDTKTFIDKALESVSSGEDFVQAMADIYSHAQHLRPGGWGLNE